MYYAKKLINKNEQLYYLISEQPSAQDGVIGWIARSEVQTHPLTYIDCDKKHYAIRGTGSSYDIPWGTKEHIVVEDLSEFTNQLFEIERTERVNNTPWYYGILSGKKMWISDNNLDVQ